MTPNPRRTKRIGDKESAWITSEELDELEAHGLHLLDDDPNMREVFNKMARKPCLQSCGTCNPCRARRLLRAERKGK